MCDIWDIPSLKIGGPKPPFSMTLQLNGKVTANIFETKRDMHHRASALQTARGLLYIVSKCHELWWTNRLKYEPGFLPTPVNSAFRFISTFRRRRSTNGTQPNLPNGGQ